MERERVYYAEYCPRCGQRACVTQAVDYSDMRVCVEALPGRDKCLEVGCCHGCQCQVNQDCIDDDGTACGCDCHRPSLLMRLREDVVTEEMEVIRPVIRKPTIRPATPITVTATTCRCDVCLGRVPLREYMAHGVLVSNRPRSCPRFAHGTRDVVSTSYNNEDGRNRRLEEFFPVRRASHCT